MKKLLVPTDFSPNSKAGVRFAIRWADAQQLELVFAHVLHVPRLTRWSDDYYEKFAAGEGARCREQFEEFITGIYKQMVINPGKHTYVIVRGGSADLAILEHCRNNVDIDCICISTRGAGSVKKLFGTNTGNLITKSPVPVLAIPQDYEGFNINTILYATDLKSYESELEQVTAFAEPFKATIDVVHFENDAGTQSFIKKMEEQVEIKKPDLVVMFTNQQRTLLQKLFQGSRAEELSFRSKIPLLVFNKKD
jgi:Universal stress protein UspA and related nucleotide-binding proteins